MGRKIPFLAFVAALVTFAASASALSGTYSVIVADNGNAAVVLSVEGEGTVDVPLPLDVESYAVDGALYVPSENGVELSIGSTGRASLIFETALLTSKSGDKWRFEMALPELDSCTVTLFLPENAAISSTQPKAAVSSDSGSKTLLWQLPKGTGSVTAEYAFVSAPAPGSGAQEGAAPDYTLAIGFVVAAVVLLAAFFYLKKKLWAK